MFVLRTCVADEVFCSQDARWRRGEAVSQDQSRNAMTSIESAAHSQLVFGKQHS